MKPPVDTGDEPQWPDHQKLEITKERRPTALVPVARELSGPTADEKAYGSQPERRAEPVEPSYDGDDEHDEW